MKMAGYNGWSKSNNAVAAENDGRYPLSIGKKIIADKIGISQKAASYILSFFNGGEWHHTSKFYNATDYYDVRACLVCCRLFRHFGFDLKKDETKIACFFNAFNGSWSGYFNKGWVREFKETLEYYKSETVIKMTEWVEWINKDGELIKFFKHENRSIDFIKSEDHDYFAKTAKWLHKTETVKKYEW